MARAIVTTHDGRPNRPVPGPTARAVSSFAMDAQLEFAEQALSLNDRGYGTFGLGPQRVAHGSASQLVAIAAWAEASVISPEQTLLRSEFSMPSFFDAG